MWNASDVQKHQQLKDMMNIHMCIYIYIDIKRRIITGDNDDINQQR